MVDTGGSRAALARTVVIRTQTTGTADDMNWEIHRRLHGRGLTQKKLAALAGTGRAHVSQVLNNKPGRGHLTRRRLFPHLLPKEVRLLGWQDEYYRWLRSTGHNVPTQT